MHFLFAASVIITSVESLQIPVYFDSSSGLHKNIYYHPEQAERINACVAELIGQSNVDLIDFSPDDPDPCDGVTQIPFSDEELSHARRILLKTHSPELVTGLEARCRESRQKRTEEGRDPLGFVGYIDDDTFVTTESYDVCLRATAAWIRAVDHALGTNGQRKTTSMALTRPPGHHATYETSNGFCLVNFAAAASIYLLESNPGLKVSIFDWDVHYGQGVAKILQKFDRARYASIHQSPAFPYLGERFGVTGEHKNILNIPILADTTWTCGYKQKFYEDVLPFLKNEEWEPDIIIICAGYDALDSDELASVGLTAKDFGFMTKELKDYLQKVDSTHIPIALGLEGGYQLSSMAGGGNLADAVVATIEALAAE